jgi:CPA1 family monovalent cation:H+ antiporter
MDVMLEFPAFAGLYATDVGLLEENAASDFFLHCGSSFMHVHSGTVTFYVSQAIGLEVGYVYCLLFGALISPVDQLQVLGILTKSEIPKH